MRAGHALLHQCRGGHAGNILAAEMDLARGRTHGACDQAEERCFASAVRSNETADLFFRDVKAYVLQRRHAPKVLGQR